MCVRYLGFVLVWFPGVLHAQSAGQPCRAPRLKDGYFVPEKETYDHETNLTYACDDGRKPTVEGWWATSTCQNGKWSHEPQCIDEAACLPPEIPNAKYTQSSNGWYEEGSVIRTTCDTGYEHKNRDATAECNNGTWSSVPVCEKSISACGVPPKVQHAVIIHQGYQEVFAPDSEVQYQCEDGYTVKGAHNNKYIFCISGQWTEGPTCRKGTRPGTGHGGSTMGGTGGGHTTSGTQPGGGGSETRPGTGHGGSTVGGTGWGHSTSAGNREQPGGGDRETRPGTGHGGSTVGGTGGGHITSAGSGTQPGGGGSETRPGTGHGGSTVGGTGGGHTTSAGSGTQPGGGGSSATSGSNVGDSRPPITTIDFCGAQPHVPNGAAWSIGRMSLKYQCNYFYTLVGSETVVCYSDRSWSELPTCKEAYCILRPGQYVWGYLTVSVREYIKEGETKRVYCGDYYYLHSVIQCTNGQLTQTNCCSQYDHDRGACPKIAL